MSKNSKRSRKYSSSIKRNDRVNIEPFSIYKTDKDKTFSSLSALDVKVDGITFETYLSLYKELQGIHEELKLYLNNCNSSLTEFLILNGEAGEWWRIFTYGLLHSGFKHFIGNIMGLSIALLFLENKTNSLTAFIIFFLGIVIGGIGYILFKETSFSFTTGASGGLWGIYGAAFVLLLNDKLNIVEIISVLVVITFGIYISLTGDNINYISHFSAFIGVSIIMNITILLNKGVIQCQARLASEY